MENFLKNCQNQKKKICVGQSYHIRGILYHICGILYHKREFPGNPYRVHQKKLLKDICYFLTLKKLPLALALIKTKNRHPFDPLVRNCSFYMRILSFQWPETIFNWKGHFLTNGSKDVLKKRFFCAPYYSRYIFPPF